MAAPATLAINREIVPDFASKCIHPRRCLEQGDKNLFDMNILKKELKLIFDQNSLSPICFIVPCPLLAQRQTHIKFSLIPQQKN